MSANNRLVLRVDNNSTFIEGRLDTAIYQKLRKALGYRPENAQFMIRNSTAKNKWGKEWDGIVTNICRSKRWCRCFVKKDGTHFSTGLLGKARDIFDDNRIAYQLVDLRDRYEPSLNLTMSDAFEYRDYQVPIIKEAALRKRGIIKIATGGGKTAVAAGIIAETGFAPCVFYVPSRSLLFQTRDELTKFLRHNGSEIKVGVCGAEQRDIQEVTVMTIQTAVRALGGKYQRYDDEDSNSDDTSVDDIKTDIKDLIVSSRQMICDEVQHWAADTCQIISDSSENCKYKFGLSATPWRDSGDDILIDACFGKSIADISASFLIQEGYLEKPEIFFVPIDNMRGMSRVSYPSIYKQGIVENNIRNAKIASIADTFQQRGRVILILCKHISHGKILNALMPGSVFLHGATPDKVREAHLAKMRAREASVTIATVIFDEGIDVRPLDTLILAGSGKSSTRALQRIGRTLRPYEGKSGALIVDFKDRCKYLSAHSSKREKIYRTEPEFNISTLEID